MTKSANRSSSSDNITFTTFTGTAGLKALKDNWQQLSNTLFPKSFQHLYLWYESYLDNLNDDVFFVQASRDGETIAIYPLMLDRRKIQGLPLMVLSSVNHPHMNLSDFIFAKQPDEAALLAALFHYLRQEQKLRWDVFLADTIPEDSALLYALQTAPLQRTLFMASGNSNYMPCTGNYEETIGRLTSRFRRNLRRLKKKAPTLGEVEYRSTMEPQELHEVFESFLEVEASGWKGNQGRQTAIRLSPGLIHFYRQLIDLFSADKKCIINSLWLDDQCLAAQFCLLVDGTVYILKIGYDEAHKQIAPGYLLLDNFTERCCADPAIEAISFVVSAPWTYDWQPISKTLYDGYVYNLTAAGITAYLIARAKRSKLADFARKWRDRKNKKPETVHYDCRYTNNNRRTTTL